MSKNFLFVLLVTLAVVNGQWDSFLQHFDLQCLQNMVQDQAAVDALNNMQDTLNPKLSDASLVNIQALQLSHTLNCISVYSDHCSSDVLVFPPRSSVSSQVDAITNEISNMSDDELLTALNYDVNGFCISLDSFQAALAPYDQCILTNLNALANLPTSIANAILQYFQQQVSDNPNPWKFNLSEALNLSNGCDDFKGLLASNLRAQLTSSYWNDVVLTVLEQYDIKGFESSVNAAYSRGEGCTVPNELACTDVQARFFSVCSLSNQQNFDFILNAPTDGNTAPGSDYYNSFVSYNEQHPGTYPCHDVFSDPCFSPVLDIPDLSLSSDCKNAGYYYGLTGETPSVSPSEMPSEVPSNSQPGNPNDSQTNPDSPSSGDSSSSSTPPPPNGSPSGLSVGGIVAIALGVTLAVLVAVAAAYFIYKRSRKADDYQVQLE